MAVGATDYTPPGIVVENTLDSQLYGSTLPANGLFVTAAGDLYWMSNSGPYKMPNGGSALKLPVPAQFCFASGVWVTAGGDVWYADQCDVVKYTGSASPTVWKQGYSNTMNSPYAVAVFSGASTDVVVADDAGSPNSGTLKRYTSAGTLVAQLGGNFDGPRAVTISPAGDVYISDNNRISKFTNGAGAAVTVSTGWSPPDKILNIWVNGAGDMYVTNNCDAYFVASGTTTKTRLFGLSAYTCGTGQLYGVVVKSGC